MKEPIVSKALDMNAVNLRVDGEWALEGARVDPVEFDCRKRLRCVQIATQGGQSGPTH